MKKIIIFIVTFICIHSHSNLYAQGNGFGLSYKIIVKHNIVPSNSFRDIVVSDFTVYADQWLSHVSDGFSIEGQVVFRIPFFLKPYFGFNYDSYNEKNENPELWKHIYLLDFDFPFEQMQSATNYKTQTFKFGIMHELDYLDLPIVPFVFGELGHQKFRAGTYLKGILSNPELGEIVNFWGRSRLETKASIEKSIGVGFNIPVGQFVLTPMFKHISAKMKVANRNLQNTYAQPPYGSVATVKGDLTIPEGHKINLSHSEIGIGLQYNFDKRETESPVSNNKRKDTFGVRLELSFGHSFTAFGEFDENRAFGDRDKWLQNVTGGLGIEGRILLNTRFRLYPYIGYHLSQFHDNIETPFLFVKQVYLYFPYPTSDFTNVTTNYKTSGFSFGFMYDLMRTARGFKPFLIVELKRQSFLAQTNFRARFIFQNEDVVASGSSTMRSKSGYGIGFGGGFSIPVGRIEFAPSFKYNSVNATLSKQSSSYSLQPPLNSSVKQDALGTDNNIIQMRYFEFKIGLRYNLIR